MPASVVAVVSPARRHAPPASATASTRSATTPQGPGLQAHRSGTVSPVDAPARPRLKIRYAEDIRTRLKDELGLANIMQVPRLEKIVINMGVGKATQTAFAPRGRTARSRADRRPEAGRDQGEEVDRRLQAPRGQLHRRQGHVAGRPNVGVLRPPRQHRHPPHPGLQGSEPRRFDGRGNYTFGITEQLIFPEIDYDKVDTTRGMDIVIVTTARSDAEGRALLDILRLPVQA